VHERRADSGNAPSNLERRAIFEVGAPGLSEAEPSCGPLKAAARRKARVSLKSLSTLRTPGAVALKEG
jgi:hypothetical protein